MNSVYDGDAWSARANNRVSQGGGLWSGILFGRGPSRELNHFLRFRVAQRSLRRLRFSGQWDKLRADCGGSSFLANRIS
jgi:hypothetical protein